MCVCVCACVNFMLRLTSWNELPTANSALIFLLPSPNQSTGRQGCPFGHKWPWTTNKSPREERSWSFFGRKEGGGSSIRPAQAPNASSLSHCSFPQGNNNYRTPPRTGGSSASHRENGKTTRARQKRELSKGRRAVHFAPENSTSHCYHHDKNPRYNMGVSWFCLFSSSYFCSL